MDAELLTLAVMQALLGYTSEARWLRYARARIHLVTMVPHLPQQPGYSKRLRKLADSMRWLTGCWSSRCRSPAMTCGSPTLDRSSAVARRRPRSVRTSQVGR